MPQLFDMHCHVGMMANGLAVANELKACGLMALNVTVTPDQAQHDLHAFAGIQNIHTAFGMHPWYVQDAELSENAIENLAASRYVGEIGLDFGAAHVQTRESQIAMFNRIVKACAERPASCRVMSIHAVKSAGTVMDILESCKIFPNTRVIFHWFSGSGDELIRARRSGCYFSVGARMLSTKRGREYARQIPTDRLMLETDAPEQHGQHMTALELAHDLEYTLQKLAALQKMPYDELSSIISHTSNMVISGT